MAFATTTELAEYVEKEIGHSRTVASSQRTDIVSHLDVANKLVHAGGGGLNYDEYGKRVRADVVFSFARAANPKIINLVAPLEPTQTVAATNGSVNITFSADPSAGVSMTDWYIRIDSQDEVYRVANHDAAATTATLDAAFVGTTVTVGTVELFKLQYAVGSSDILRLISPIRPMGASRGSRIIALVDKDQMMDEFPLEDVDENYPSRAAIIHESGGTYTLQFNSYNDATARLEADYISIPSTLVAGSVNPTMPEHFRLVLAHLACYHLLLRNDDTRAKDHMKLAQDKFSEMVDWNEGVFSAGDPDYGRVTLSGFSPNWPTVGVERGFDIS